VATVFIAGTLMNTAQSSMPALAAAFYPTRGRATGVAWMLGIGRFGGIAGSFLVAELSARHLGFSEIFTAVAVPGLVATVAVLLKDFAAGRPAPPPPGEPADPGRTGLPLIRPLIRPPIRPLPWRPPHDHRRPRPLHHRPGRPGRLARPADRRPQGPEQDPRPRA
jgi:MFS family permease